MATLVGEPLYLARGWAPVARLVDDRAGHSADTAGGDERAATGRGSRIKPPSAGTSSRSASVATPVESSA
jgi:hypothetical protein